MCTTLTKGTDFEKKANNFKLMHKTDPNCQIARWNNTIVLTERSSAGGAELQLRSAVRAHDVATLALHDWR